MLKRSFCKIVRGLLLIAVAALVIIGSFVAAPQIKAAWFDKEEKKATAVSEHDMVCEDNGFFGYTAVDFGPVIMGKASELSDLIVFERTMHQKETFINEGILNVSYLEKKQTVKYNGDSVWTVDLEKLSDNDIKVDNEKKMVSVEVPFPEVKIKLDVTKTKLGKVEKNKLVPGNIKITPEAHKEMENRALTDMYAKVATSGDAQKAQNAAVKKIEKLFDPVIGSVAKGYTVNVTFKAA